MPSNSPSTWHTAVNKTNNPCFSWSYVLVGRLPMSLCAEGGCHYPSFTVIMVKVLLPKITVWLHINCNMLQPMESRWIMPGFCHPPELWDTLCFLMIPHLSHVVHAPWGGTRGNPLPTLQVFMTFKVMNTSVFLGPPRKPGSCSCSGHCALLSVHRDAMSLRDWGWGHQWGLLSVI